MVYTKQQTYCSENSMSICPAALPFVEFSFLPFILLSASLPSLLLYYFPFLAAFLMQYADLHTERLVQVVDIYYSSETAIPS